MSHAVPGWDSEPPWREQSRLGHRSAGCEGRLDERIPAHAAVDPAVPVVALGTLLETREGGPVEGLSVAPHFELALGLDVENPTFADHERAGSRELARRKPQRRSRRPLPLVGVVKGKHAVREAAAGVRIGEGRGDMLRVIEARRLAGLRDDRDRALQVVGVDGHVEQVRAPVAELPGAVVPARTPAKPDESVAIGRVLAQPSHSGQSIVAGGVEGSGTGP